MNIDRFKKLVSVVYPCALIAVLTFNYSYYYYFNIEINNYIGLDDLVLGFGYNAMFITAFVVPFFSLAMLIADAATAEMESYNRRIIFFLLFLTAGILLIWFFNEQFYAKRIIERVFLIAAFFLTLVFASVAKWIYDRNEAKEIKFGVTITIAAFFGIIGFPLLMGVNKAKSLTKPNQVILEFNDNTMYKATDSNTIYYLGKTKDYVFMYNDDKDTTFAFTASNIKQLQIVR